MDIRPRIMKQRNLHVLQVLATSQRAGDERDGRPVNGEARAFAREEVQVYIPDAAEVMPWVFDPGREGDVAGDEVDAENVFAQEDGEAFVSRLAVCG